MSWSAKKLIPRLIFLFLAFGLLVCGGLLAYFSSWRVDRLEELSSRSDLALTTAGPVEFLTRGDGPAVMVFHGMPGGYDQAMLVGSVFVESGFQVIAPSRPGYLRTPLATGATPAQQADAMAALLDSLGVQSVGVVGLDAGGPVALEFALRYPGRTWGLVLMSAMMAAEPQGDADGEGPLKAAAANQLMGDMASWLFVETAEDDPGRALNMFMTRDTLLDADSRKAITDYVLASPDQSTLLQEFINTLVPLSARMDGLRNDLQNLRTGESFPFQLLGIPTLVINGQQDGVAPLAEAKATADRIPNAQRLFPENTGHILLFGPQSEAVNAGMVNFLQQYSSGESQP